MHPERHVAIIDVDPLVSAQLAETLESNFENAKTHRFPSYAAFLAAAKALAPAKSGLDAVKGQQKLAIDPRAPIGQAFPAGREQALTVLAGSLDLVEASPPLASGERILGIDVGVLRDRPADWTSVFVGDEIENLHEFATVVAAGRTVVRAARAAMADGTQAYLEIRGKREKSADGEGEAKLRFDFRQIDAAAYEKLAPSSGGPGAMKTVDALFVDGSLISSDLAAWYSGLRELLTAARMIPAELKIPVLITADEGGAPGPKDFRAVEVRDFLYRPLDRRLVVEKATVAIAGLVPKEDAPSVEFHVCSSPVLVAKDIEIEEFSEYGALVKHRTPLRDDSFMALYGGALTGEAHEPVWARCTSCAKAGQDDGYLCFFRFFGISEETLKRIRSWIREDYVSKKEPAA